MVSWLPSTVCILGILLAAVQGLSENAPSLCTSDADCEAWYRKGSNCLASGRCSNPFTAGCLRSFANGTEFAPNMSALIRETLMNRRVCNSEDRRSAAAANGSSLDCRTPPFAYPEIRVHNGNWDSRVFYSWIIQIFLSEFLQVPVRVGLANETAQASFYSPDAEMSFSTQAYAFEEIKVANRLGGHCERTTKSCIHVMPEVWIGQEKRWQQAFVQGQIDQVHDNGEVGKISWYIPFYTARQYPEFTVFEGLAGNRDKLAQIFLRPTAWGDYCRDVSSTQCAEPDGVATRKPLNQEEEAVYYANGTYTGHFRATEKNDCGKNPHNCTGHIASPGCSWDTYVEGQAYYNNISLESDGNDGYDGGYAYTHMLQIWKAAAVTKSHIIMWWWTPDASIEEYRGSDFEFQRILLPDPTLQCKESRITPSERCSADPLVRRGTKQGSCDNEFSSLQKIIARSLREMTFQVPLADQSPAYQAIINLRINQLQMDAMFRQWVEKGMTGLGAREVVCDFVFENKEQLIQYFPRGFPRILRDRNAYKRVPLYVAQAAGALALLYLVLAFAGVIWWRNSAPFAFAQRTFMLLILFGLVLVSIGSVLYALEPQDGVCLSQMWMVTLGYTMELVPLLVKVAAINRLMVTATHSFRRIRIEPQRLMATVAIVACLVCVLLMVYSIVDPPRRKIDRYLMDSGQNSVQVLVSCQSGWIAWSIVALCWEGLLIVAAVVLAFQSRKVKVEFNSSTNLGILIYSHFVFFALRVLLFYVADRAHSTQPFIAPDVLAAATSFLLSIDVVIAVTVYVLPKLIAAKYPKRDRNSVAMSDAVREIENLAKEASKHLNSIASGSGSNSDHLRAAPEFEQEFLQIFGGQKSSPQSRDDFDDSSRSIRSFGTKLIPIPDDWSSTDSRRTEDQMPDCDDKDSTCEDSTTMDSVRNTESAIGGCSQGEAEASIRPKEETDGASCGGSDSKSTSETDMDMASRSIASESK